MFPLKLFLIFFFLFFFEIDHITLDPDPNWTKIQDPDPKFNLFVMSQQHWAVGQRSAAAAHVQPRGAGVQVWRVRGSLHITTLPVQTFSQVGKIGGFPMRDSVPHTLPVPV